MCNDRLALLREGVERMISDNGGYRSNAVDRTLAAAKFEEAARGLDPGDVLWELSQDLLRLNQLGCSEARGSDAVGSGRGWSTVLDEEE